VFPSAAHAQFLVVDCSGVNPSAFPTINSALPFLAGPSAFILVTGPCNENVSLNGVNDLAIAALFGQTANINGNLSINNCQNVFLGGLNIANSFGDGIDVSSSRSVVLDSVSSNGNSFNGLTVGGTSDVAIINFGTFDNNGADGIFVGSNSLVTISSFGGITEISNNQKSAVGIDRAVFESFGNTYIAGNSQVAIDSRGAGRALLLSVFGPSSNPTIIENNPNGAVSLQETSEIAIGSVLPSPVILVRNNGPFGIQAGFGSQVTLAGATITGHTGPGVDIYAHSQLHGTSQLPGLDPTLIQSNGTAGDPLSAGVRVDGNSQVLLRGVNVSENNGPAILALVNSSADFAGNTFSGNTGVITCDSTSTMVSDLGASASNPAAGVRCGVAHSLGSRALSTPAPAVPDTTAGKAMHNAYQQRSAAHK
jgi:hypothetical protein